jgi:hypothetical protein
MTRWFALHQIALSKMPWQTVAEGAKAKDKVEDAFCSPMTDSLRWLLHGYFETSRTFEVFDFPLKITKGPGDRPRAL